MPTCSTIRGLDKRLPTREMTQEQINNRYKMRFFNDDLLASSPTNLRELSFLTLKIITQIWVIS